MHARSLGNTGIAVSPIGFGAFKIGRNEKTKYSSYYDLPNDAEADRLLNELLDMGVTLIDTAPAYGLSEERVGRAIAHRRNEFVLSTKVGETFENGLSAYDFSADAICDSVQRSLRRLNCDAVDVLLIHSDGRDDDILHETDAVESLMALKSRGITRAIGFSGKTVAGAQAALPWADVLMVEYHLDDRSHAAVIAEAAAQGVGVLVKKGLASGELSAEAAIRFVLSNVGVSSMVIGGLNADHFRTNIAAAAQLDTNRAA